jgi:hypothetical protein
MALNMKRFLLVSLTSIFAQFSYAELPEFVRIDLDDEKTQVVIQEIRAVLEVRDIPYTVTPFLRRWRRRMIPRGPWKSSLLTRSAFRQISVVLSGPREPCLLGMEW